MKLKCSYCGTIYDENLQVCPYCGAINEKVVRTANGVPQTIEELKQFCQSKNLPLDKFRFFIGVNYKEPKAFGIYEENGVYTVYKNKADGSRAIRYQGTDEAYAVNEIYQKLHSEVVNYKEFVANKQIQQNQQNQTKNNQYSTQNYNQNQNKNRRHSKFALIWILIFMTLMPCMAIGTPMILMFSSMGSFFGTSSSTPYYSEGYYRYNDKTYYHSSRFDYWYVWDEDEENWTKYSSPSEDLLEYAQDSNNSFSQYKKGFEDDLEEWNQTRWEDSEYPLLETKEYAQQRFDENKYITDYYRYDDDYYYYSTSGYWYKWNSDKNDWDYISNKNDINFTSTPDYYQYIANSDDIYSSESSIIPFYNSDAHELDQEMYEKDHQSSSYDNSSNYNSSWDDDWDYDWDSGWDDDYSSDWDSDW